MRQSRKRLSGWEAGEIGRALHNINLSPAITTTRATPPTTPASSARCSPVALTTLLMALSSIDLTIITVRDSKRQYLHPFSGTMVTIVE